jgi:hypothetical protein|tara:strand:+ start:1590 stop:2291 length:702 start_codon:yes stop_codon:yes gene_type:complete
MAARSPDPIYSVLSLGLSAFVIHSLLAKKKMARFGGYGQGPGPTIFDPRPQGGDAPSLEDDEADSEEDDEGDDGEDGETEDEETDDGLPPVSGGAPNPNDPPPPPEGGFKPWVPGWAPPNPEGPNVPPGGNFPGILKGPKGGGSVGGGPGGQATIVFSKADPSSGGPVQKMAPMPISAPTPSAGKPGLAGYYDFNGYGALSTERAEPVFQKILVTLSAYFIVAGIYDQLKKRR